MDKTISSRMLVRGAFEFASLPRLPFLPWVFTHAARLEQVSVRRMYTDPTRYVKCLQNARKLYGYDGMATGFDASLEAELGGCPVNWSSDDNLPVAEPQPGFDFGRLGDTDVESAAKTGRFGTVTESLRRIKIVSGTNLALAAAITGPLTLAAVLTGKDPVKTIMENPEEIVSRAEAAAGFLLKVVQVYCQLEPDIIVIADRLMPLVPAEYLSQLESVLSPLVNTVRFYNAFSVLVPGEPSPENLFNLVGLGFDGIVAPGIDLKMWREIKGGRNCVLGLAIPSGILTRGEKVLEEYLESQLPGGPGPGVFLTTDWEVPADIPPENIRAIMNLISGA